MTAKHGAHDAREVTVPAAGVMTIAATSLVLVLGMTIRVVLSLLLGGRAGTSA